MTSSTRRALLRAGGAAGAALLLTGTGLTGTGPARSGSAVRAAAAADAPSGATVLGSLRPGALYVLNGDGSDTTALWQEAFNGIARAGRGAVRVIGEHLVTRELTLPDAAALEISGEGDALIRKGEPGRVFRIFTNERPQAPLSRLSIRNLSFLGDWDQEPSPGGDGARCIAVRGYYRVRYQGLTVEAFRNMSLTADDCDEVLVENCRVLRSARDAINLTGSRFVKVLGCTIQNCWDDAIAVHVPRDVSDESRRYATLISNNQILQVNGIKVLGGRDVSILGNQLIAPTNYGVYLGRDKFWREGDVEHRNVVIADNLISEMMSYEYLRGQGRIGVGIFFADEGRRVQATRISGNVITKYKPSGRGVRFSDWGFGPHRGERRFFTPDGWTDPELVHGHAGKGIGIRVVAANADDQREIAIDGNSFAGLATDVDRRVAP